MLGSHYATISNLIEMARREKKPDAVTLHFESLALALMTFVINTALGGYGCVTEELLGYLDGIAKAGIRTIDSLLSSPPFGGIPTPK